MITINGHMQPWKLTFVVFASLVLVTTAFGQTTDSASTDTSTAAPAPSATFVTFQQEQTALNEELDALVAQGATQDQIDAWQQQNAARFQAQVERAQEMSADAAKQPMTYVTEVAIPDGASQELVDLLVTGANLYNSFVEIHNELISDPTASTTDPDTLAQTEVTLFQQQNGADLADQAGQVKVVTSQEAKKPLPVPQPFTVPAGTDAELAAFLTIKNQIERQDILLHNQYCAGATARVDAAILQWQNQHPALFQQMTQMAQDLAQPTQN